MAIYAIGDIQGCYEDLQNLLNKISFNPIKDKLWFVGDLVNRGPDSLKTLRFVKKLGSAAQIVLGNHDLHLIAIYHGIKKNKDSSINDILKAPDSKELIDWLRKQPLLHYDKETKFTLVHAGIYPLWKLKQAKVYAKELEHVLRGDDYLDFIKHMYGNKPAKWSNKLKGWDRLRFICNSFTRMRYCKKKGELEFDENGVPGSQSNKLVPWYEFPERVSKKKKIIFGHWSTLGYFIQPNGLTLVNNVYATDTGCVWGGKLTALKIDVDIDGDTSTKFISVDCPQRSKPNV